MYAAILEFTGRTGVAIRNGELRGALADKRKLFISPFDLPFADEKAPRYGYVRRLEAGPIEEVSWEKRELGATRYSALCLRRRSDLFSPTLN